MAQLAERLEWAFANLQEKTGANNTTRAVVQDVIAGHFPRSDLGGPADLQTRHRRCRRKPPIPNNDPAEIYGRSPPVPAMQRKLLVDPLARAEASRGDGMWVPTDTGASESADELVPESLQSKRLRLRRDKAAALISGSITPKAESQKLETRTVDATGDLQNWGFVVANSKQAISFEIKGLKKPHLLEQQYQNEETIGSARKKTPVEHRAEYQRPRTCGLTRTASLSSAEAQTAQKQRLQRIGGSARTLGLDADSKSKNSTTGQRCESAVAARRANIENGSLLSARQRRPTTSGPTGRLTGASVRKKNGLVKPELASQMTKEQRYEHVLELLAAQNGDADKVDSLAFYILGEELGKGAFGSVRAATHIMSGEKVAIKTYDKYKVFSLYKNQGQAISPDVCMHEVRLLERLSHPNIITMHQTICTTKKVHMVLDHVSAGDLADYVRFRSKLPEPEARWLFKQVLSGLTHCQRKKVAHRDLKMENVMLLEDQTVKIIDFGMGEFTDSGRKLRLQCGTPAYAAPEIWADKSYSGPQADIWSLGVMLYIMLVGKVPFHHPNAGKMFEMVTAARFSLPDFLSADACSFVRAMLTADPRRRATVKALRAHPWLREEADGGEENPDEEEKDVSDEGSDGEGEEGSKVIAEMLRLGFDVSRIREDLQKRKRSNTTVCYRLLRRRSRRLRGGDEGAAG